MTTRLYFAYGSNLHPRRLAERAPSAVALGPAALEGHAMRFHKRGRDGSGKCDATWTGRPGDVVLGMLYRLSAADVATLDRREGAGDGYEARAVRVRSGDDVVAAFTYLAVPSAVDPALTPWDWYKALVVAGARHHRFPADYVRAIDAVPSRPDPDPERAREHEALLARIAAASA